MAGVEISRFPDEFDGVIMGAPALDFTGLVATFFTWIKKANTGPDGQAILPASKFKLVGDAVYKLCADKGGLVSQPLQCHFNPASLQCKVEDEPDCLTAAQVGVMAALRTARDSSFIRADSLSAPNRSGAIG